MSVLLRHDVNTAPHSHCKSSGVTVVPDQLLPLTILPPPTRHSATAPVPPIPARHSATRLSIYIRTVLQKHSGPGTVFRWVQSSQIMRTNPFPKTSVVITFFYIMHILYLPVTVSHLCTVVGEWWIQFLHADVVNHISLKCLYCNIVNPSAACRYIGNHIINYPL